MSTRDETQQDQWTFEAVDRMIRAAERSASAAEMIRTVVVAWAILTVLGAVVFLVAQL